MARNFTALFLCLLGTWFLLSGFTSPLFITLAVFSCAIAVWLRARMRTDQKDRPFLVNIIQFPVYLVWLIKEIFKSTFSVAKLVWHPNLTLKPTFAWIPTAQQSDVGKTMYANSITLTPGTITVVVRGNQLGVHALQSESLDDLRSGEMDKRILECYKGGA